MSDRLEADPVAHSVAAGIGGALSMAVTYPLVTLSTLAQTKSQKSVKEGRKPDEEEGGVKDKALEKVSTLAAAKYLLKHEGVLGFYSGLESAIYGVVVNNVVYYYFYEALVKVIIKNRTRGKQQLSPVESILTGAVAGSVTALSTNPIWVANTRITVKGNNRQSTLSAIIEIIKKDGVGALFSGVLPALILVLNPIIQYTIFEQLKNFINKRKAGGITSGHAFIIGALGKLIATGSTYPYITLKARMHLQNENGNRPTTIAGWAKEIYTKEGIRGFYNGVGVKLSQSVLTAAFLFFFKEELTTLAIKLLRVARRSKRLSGLKR
ncbi:CYFA0S01e09890g1_1 [Cyberlindnera fabianii]|uniref:CYFA0S01e09890g1_1 n=1 Tax=Cyberlindnera fabianii TaxID=36022 RepID=A0A061AJN2_CYBFA|nr:Peroxisomal membrane protein PMP47A [Cyberlindnera fabianii]CDR37351.1 CYFA0S01e09890g1_1 [Cyberlindnera fabianii]